MWRDYKGVGMVAGTLARVGGERWVSRGLQEEKTFPVAVTGTSFHVDLCFWGVSTTSILASGNIKT